MPIPVERNRLAQKCARPSPDLRYPFDEDRKCSSCGIAPPVGRRFEHSPSGRSLSNSLARAHITGIIDTALAVKSNIFNAAVYLVGEHERSLLATRGGSQPRHGATLRRSHSSNVRFWSTRKLSATIGRNMQVIVTVNF